MSRKYLWMIASLLMLFHASHAQVGPQTQEGDEREESPTLPVTQAPVEQSLKSEDVPALDLFAAPSEPPPGTPSFLFANLVLGEGLHWYRSGKDTSTDISGNLTLLKVWHRSVSELDYLGGASFYPSDSPQDTQQVQSLGVVQQFLWPRRRLTIADSLGNSNAGGTFGSSLLGGVGLTDLIFAGSEAEPSTIRALSLFQGSTVFGAGTGSQIINVSEVQLADELTQRSTITLLGGYGISTYFDSNPDLVNSNQISTAVQYGHQVSARATVGVFYGYRRDRYPLSSEGTLTSNIVQGVYQRVVSPRLTIALGAGPEFANTTSETIIPIIRPPLVVSTQTNQISLSGYTSIVYRFKNSSLGINYQRLTTSGSGIFAGANTEAAQVSLNRSLFRSWTTSASSGYGSLREIQQNSPAPTGGSYKYWYIAAALSRSLGPRVSLIASYQFNDDFVSATCNTASGCVGFQSTASFGIAWHARPIRIDRSNPGTTQPDNLDTPEGGEPTTNTPPI